MLLAIADAALMLTGAAADSFIDYAAKRATDAVIDRATEKLGDSAASLQNALLGAASAFSLPSAVVAATSALYSEASPDGGVERMVKGILMEALAHCDVSIISNKDLADLLEKSKKNA